MSPNFPFRRNACDLGYPAPVTWARSHEMRVFFSRPVYHADTPVRAVAPLSLGDVTGAGIAVGALGVGRRIAEQCRAVVERHGDTHVVISCTFSLEETA